VEGNFVKDATALALRLLRGSPEYIADAREGARVGNSVVGSLLSLPPHSIPRQHAEQAVLEALTILDSSSAESAESGHGGNYTLRRSGQPALRFQGELLAESDGAWHAGREQNRYHELAVYRTAGGKYVVAVGYRTRWQGETDHDSAEIVDAPTNVAGVLRDYDPTGHVGGFPAGPAYAEKQARLLADLRRRYDDQVSDVLGASDEFMEGVE
jgi:hypothetical protein